MERRKGEARSQLVTLKQECEMTAQLLDRLIQTCSKHLSDIETLDSRSFRMYSKYFLAVLHFQSVSIQKIMEWNIDLEEFLTEKEPPNIDHFKILSVNRSCSDKSLSDVETCSLSPTSIIHENPLSETVSKTRADVETNRQSKHIVVKTTPEKEFSVSETASKTTANVEINSLSKHTNDDKASSEVDVSVSETVSKSSANIDCHSQSKHTVHYTACSEIETCNIDVNAVVEGSLTDVAPVENESSIETDKSSDQSNNEINIKSQSESDTTTADSESSADTNDFEIVPAILNESVSSSEYFYSVSSVIDDKSSNEIDDIPSYWEFCADSEEPKPVQKTQTSELSEKLRQLSKVSLKDKFLERLPKAPMPDLSLRPASQQPRNSEQLSVLHSNYQDLKYIKNEKRENDSNGKEPKVRTEKNTKKLQEYKNHIDLVVIKDRVAPKVGDICIIGYVESPAEMYIQVVDENSVSLDMLSTQLAELYHNTSFLFTSKADALKTLGTFCSFNADSTWCRVEVLDWKLKAETDDIIVQLVDYGHKYKISYKDLRPLQPELRILPRISQLCHLGYLYPPGSTTNRPLKVWPHEVMQNIFSVLGDLDSTVFKIVHVRYCAERKSYEIDLVKTDEENKESTIGQLLLDSQLAVEITDVKSKFSDQIMKDQILSAQGLCGISPDMAVEDILEKYFQNNSDEMPDNINEAITGYDPRDEAETCRNLRKDGTCYKGKTCKLRHVPLREGFTRDREPVFNSAFETGPLLHVGEEVFMTISHIVDISCFYAQIRKDNLFPGYPRPTLSNLINTMNSPEFEKTYKKLRYPPAHSEMVIAKHWNGYWYRAQVRNVQISESNEIVVEVFIVDFGDTLTVPLCDLRVMVSELLFMSFQAFECRLDNVRHKDSLDPDKEKLHFERRYLGQTFKAKIMGVHGHLDVLLKNDEGEDIGFKLIEDGFGELSTYHVSPAENELILID